MSENTSLRERLKTLATAMYADGDEWNAYDLLLDAAAALSTPPAEGDDAADAKRWRHVREMFAEEMLETLFGIDPSLECNATGELDAACDADIESDAAMIAATEGSNE